MERVIRVEEIERIEGHLNFEVIIRENGDVEAKAMAREGNRLVGKILVNRPYREIPDIAARMCGVCSVIHKLTAVQAIENAISIDVPEDAKLLRELLGIAGHIQSHLLHLFYFVIPDYLGATNLLEIRNEEIRAAIPKIIKVKKWANEIIQEIGGRPVHPVTPVVGGLSKAPRRSFLQSISSEIKEVRKLVIEIIDTLLKIDFPRIEMKTNYVSLTSRDTIPLLWGSVRINNRVIEPEKYLNQIVPVIEEYSTAPHFLLRNNEPYMVSALSRLNNNFDKLSINAKEFCREHNLSFPQYSPFSNNIAQGVEIIHFLDRAEEILEKLLQKREIEHLKKIGKIRGGTGVAITEAPRGLLIHKYGVNNEGEVTEAIIITPTTQNLKNIERDAEIMVKKLIKEGYEARDIEEMVYKLIRSYDPCISCAARFKYY